MVADGETAMLDLFFNNDGTTAITPSGKNTEISLIVKILLEAQCEFTGKILGETYVITVKQNLQGS